MTCANCAGTGISLNSQVYVERGNPNSGTLPLTTRCECQTKTITGEVDAADSLTGYSSDQPKRPTKQS